jgi:hypothetical protein
MAKLKNNFSSAIKQLSSAGSAGKSLDMVNQPSSIARSGKLSLGTSGDTKSQSFSARTVSTGINFGKHSETSPTNSSSVGQEMTNLLKQSVSGGVMGALGGSFGLSSFGGIGTIVSSIASLFGGGPKTLPPLVDFTLPNAQNLNVYLGPNASTVHQGSIVQSGNLSQPGATPTYKTPTTAEVSSSSAPSQPQNAQIVQAVKTALLNSSSLNDVIAEI